MQVIQVKLNQRFKNSIRINFFALINSVGVRLTIAIVFLLSAIVSFWPGISYALFNYKISNDNNSSSKFYFLIALGLIVLLYMVLLITRVGAQIGFEKGNKVTEIILTSITRSQLYTAHVISSFEVLLVSFSIIFSPMIAAFFIKNNSISINMDFLTLPVLIFVSIHTILISVIFVILAVAITSIVKRSEDTGPCMIIVLLPVFISNTYFLFTNSIYTGFFLPLNYIPLFSLITAIGACINGDLSLWMQITMLLSDVIFIVIAYVVGKRIFNKNIAVC